MCPQWLWKGGRKMNGPQTPEEFCRFLWHQYLVERRYDFLAEVVDPALSVIGTGAHEVSRNVEAFEAAMARESGEWNGSFLIKDQWYQTTALSDGCCLVMGELVVRESAADGLPYDLHFRFTVVLRKGDGGWKLVHVHQSVPDPNQTQDEFFPHRMLEQTGQQIIYNLRHDSLTGLLNRLYLTETASRLIGNGPQGWLLVLGIDRFKDINDDFGHPFGDKVLVSLAQSIKSAFSQAVAGRVGGDEFVVYLPGEMSQAALERLLARFKGDWAEGQQALRAGRPITVSIGVSQCPRDGADYETLWQRADEALYTAKKGGRDQVCFRRGGK